MIWLFWIGNPELSADLSRQQIGDLRVAGHGGDPARVGEIYILAVFRSFIDERAAKPLRVPNQFPALYLHLELLDHDLSLRTFREIDGLPDHTNGIGEVFTCLF